MKRVHGSARALLMAIAAVWSLTGAIPQQASESIETANAFAHTPGVADPAKSLIVANDGSLKTSIATVPVQPQDGVRIGEGKDAFTINLPDATGVGKSFSNKGMLIYGGGNGVVAAQEGVQFLKKITSANDPEEFTYNARLPEGSRIAMSVPGPGQTATQGPAGVVVNRDGIGKSFIDLPWAYDATGKPVKTHYTTNGSSLTQHVDHRQPGIVYPVVADPNFRWYRTGVVVTFTYDDMVSIAAGGVVTATSMIGVSAPTIVGPVVISTAVLPIAFQASYAVARHVCAWIWIPDPLLKWNPDWGWYAC